MGKSWPFSMVAIHVVSSTYCVSRNEGHPPADLSMLLEVTSKNGPNFSLPTRESINLAHLIFFTSWENASVIT